MFSVIGISRHPVCVALCLLVLWRCEQLLELRRQAETVLAAQHDLLTMFPGKASRDVVVFLELVVVHRSKQSASIIKGGQSSRSPWKVPDRRDLAQVLCCVFLASGTTGAGRTSFGLSRRCMMISLRYAAGADTQRDYMALSGWMPAC